MKKAGIITPLIGLFFTLLLAGCGGGKKTSNKALEEKKAQLAGMLKEQDALSGKITALQLEISKLDPNGVEAKSKLVALDTISTGTFDHYIDLQGKIDAQNIAFVAPKGQGGVVKQVFVKQGDQVSKGQVLLKLDDISVQQNVVAAQQQQAGVAAQLKQAQSVYARQQNLWKENIGTELQVLNAKTSVENLQSQYNAATANVKLAQEQLNNTTVRAGMSGVINNLNIKVGEFFSGNNQIQLVNSSDLKVTVNVPENYSGNVAKGSLLSVTLPDVGNKKLTTQVNVLGKMIDPVTRTFYIEGKVPQDPAIRPNQVAMVSIKDYTAKDAITIPANCIQNDEKGKFVMIASRSKDNKLVAKKRYVTVGQMYRDQLEVKSGLDKGDVVISDGFQSLYDGQPIVTGL